jgi:hypothetical protein
MSLTWTEHTANKSNRYRCAGCGNIIRPGERYRLARWNRSAEVARYHIACEWQAEQEANAQDGEALHVKTWGLPG